jgi:hypothetical protein
MKPGNYYHADGEDIRDEKAGTVSDRDMTGSPVSSKNIVHSNSILLPICLTSNYLPFSKRETAAKNPGTIIELPVICRVTNYIYYILKVSSQP